MSEQTPSTRPGREVAERERERAHDAQAVRDADDRGRLLGDRRRQRRLEREELDLVLRAHVAEPLPVQPGALAAARRPLLAGAEVVDVAEDDVAHRRRRPRPRARGRSAGSPRFAFSEPSIGSSTTRAPPPPSTDLADLLRDERVVLEQLVEPRDRDRARPPRRSPSSRRRPCPRPTIGSRSARVGSSTSTRRDVVDERAADREPVGHSGMEEQPADELRIEVRRLLRQHLAALRDREDVLDARRPEQERGVRARPRRRRRSPRRRTAV